jgi:polyisoprenoid-binding protein YceI
VKPLIIIFLGAILNSCLCPLAPAQTLSITDGSVEWTAVSTLGVVKIKGVGGKPAGSVQIVDGKASGTFECLLATFDTDNALRNEHMRDKYLETLKYPKATLVLDPVAPSESDFEWTGTLKLKGQTRPVKGKGRFKGGALWAELVVSLEDFPAVGIPSWQGVTVAKNVTITVRAKVGS